MKLENNTPQKSTLTGSNNNYELSYGVIKQNTNGDLEVKLIADENIKSVRTQVSCGGCTKATATKLNDKEWLVKINYKTSLLGKINKGVFLYPQKENGTQLPKINIKLTGNVIK